jgi:hypothetical protein
MSSHKQNITKKSTKIIKNCINKPIKSKIAFDSDDDFYEIHYGDNYPCAQTIKESLIKSKAPITLFSKQMKEKQKEPEFSDEEVNVAKELDKTNDNFNENSENESNEDESNEDDSSEDESSENEKSIKNKKISKITIIFLWIKNCQI